MLHFPTRRVEVCHLKIPISNLPQNLYGTRIVQLSDFHYGVEAMPQDLLHEVIETVKRLQPDLICYTGDFINGNADVIIDLCGALQSIQGKYGNLAVLGNHDYFQPGSAAIVKQALEQINIRVLQNEVCYPMGPGLAIVGLKCIYSYTDIQDINPDRVLAQVSEGIPKIILTHGPRYNELIANWKIDLHLSGHTHGGQIALPGIGPLLPKFWDLFYRLPGWLQSRLFTKLPHRIKHNQESRYIRGVYRRNQGFLYVNRGLGTHLPGRLFCRPEITVLTLIADQDIGLNNQGIKESARLSIPQI